MSSVNRRNFQKASGVVILPAFVPSIGTAAEHNTQLPSEDPIIKFFYDGKDFSPSMNVDELQKINKEKHNGIFL